jgi:protein-disulfide isomerase
MAKQTPVRPDSPSNNGPRRLTPKQEAMMRRQRTRRRNQLIISSIAIVVVVAVAAIIFTVATTPPSIPVVPTAVTTDTGSFIIGDPNAKVTLTEWGDFRCSACDSFFTNVEPAIMSDYVKAGKIKFEFKNFITIDGSSTTGDSHNAAAAGWCAADQNRFWDFYQTMYSNYPGENPGYWTTNRLKAVGQKLNLDTAKFNTCIDTNQHRQDVLTQNQQAQTNGYTGTPTLVLDGTALTISFADVNAVRGAIDQEITKMSNATTPSANTTPGAASTTTAAAATTTSATTTAAK